MGKASPALHEARPTTSLRANRIPVQTANDKPPGQYPQTAYVPGSLANAMGYQDHPSLLQSVFKGDSHHAWWLDPPG
jgi:hypothetical protein